jgi:2-C-methyl-D-erythritol 2,4-cyclodiphosphate synthase/2-C-methyl-D-erythritol 4-phosphate cytidylyltransferase/2-C-methyl-D-erythritol 2,4-cyclodiphosphate synthase
MFRVGLGKDIHRLVPKRPFLLGGVELPFEKGEAGHSDGDVLIHAVIDALLGAAGMGDIGELFPPGDPEWKDAGSKKLLALAWNMVKKEGWNIVNLDCVVCCEAPKILPHREKIRESLANVLGIKNSQVFVKGKTAETLGEIGRGEAVEALALCLLSADEHSTEPQSGEGSPLEN